MKQPSTIRWFALSVALATGFGAAATAGTTLPAPASARDDYNAGTRWLAEKKFAEAEKMFQSALAAQDDRVQPPALYNLGHTYFASGAEQLKQGPDAQAVAAQSQAAMAAGDHAMLRAEASLMETNLEMLVAAYLEGNGARHELREAEKAVKSAVETYAKTLQAWQRSVDAFKGAAELNPADTHAAENALRVERGIARLVDSLRQMQSRLGQMGRQKQDLGRLLSKLKGRIPAADAPPGAAGDDDEDENGITPDALTGQAEHAARPGDQMEVPLSPDQAGQILDGLSLDGSRRLPMSDQEGPPPKDKKGRNW